MTEDRRPRPEFLARPPEALIEPQWQIRRVRAKGTLGGVCLSHNLVGCYTHFFRGSTVPCPSQGTCEACDSNISRRWHSWFGAWAPETGGKCIVEVTLRAVSTFDARFRTNRTLRGCKFAIKRVPERDNGKLHVVLTDGDVPNDAIPKDCDVVKHLMRMWGYAVDLSPAKLFDPAAEAHAKRQGDAS
jgi:hypothetical protein